MGIKYIELMAGVLEIERNPILFPIQRWQIKFPDWSSSIGTVEENEDSLYRYVYMGFGNGLSIKKDLYEPFMKHLAFAVDRYAENRNIDRSEKEKNKYAIIFNVWDEAVVNIAADINVDLL